MVLYNLTHSRELTQPWCGSSPWGDSDQHAAYIPSMSSASAVLPYVLLVLILPTPQRDGRLSTPSLVEWVLNPGPVTWQSAALPTELSWLDSWGDGQGGGVIWAVVLWIAYPQENLQWLSSERWDVEIPKRGSNWCCPQHGSWCLPLHHHRKIYHHLWKC